MSHDQSMHAKGTASSVRPSHTHPGRVAIRYSVRRTRAIHPFHSFIQSSFHYQFVCGQVMTGMTRPTQRRRHYYSPMAHQNGPLSNNSRPKRIVSFTTYDCCSVASSLARRIGGRLLNGFITVAAPKNTPVVGTRRRIHPSALRKNRAGEWHSRTIFANEADQGRIPVGRGLCNGKCGGGALFSQERGCSTNSRQIVAQVLCV